MIENIIVRRYEPMTSDEYNVPTRETMYDPLNGNRSIDERCFTNSTCPLRKEKETSINAEPMVNKSANLCGDMIRKGRNVKAKIMQTTPAAAKIPNIVNLSLVAEMSFTELEILAEAHDIKPADSSSCC